MKNILCSKWEMITPAFYDRDRTFPFPRLIFPLVAAIRDTELLEVPENFERDLKFLSDGLRSPLLSGGIPDDERFILVLLLHSIFATYESEQLGPFMETIGLLKDEFMAKLVGRFGINFELCWRRLAMAAAEDFDLEDFIADFERIWDGVAHSVDFPESIRTFVLRTLVEQLDVRVVNRILSEGQFAFSAAIVWNSFLVSRDDADFVLFRQLTRLVMTAPAIAAQRIEIPAVVAECTGLTPDAIVFVLANLRVDEFVPKTIDFEKFAEALGVSLPLKEVTLPPREPIQFDRAAGDLALEQWNHVVIPRRESRLFPFLTEYAFTEGN
jgi:hypothetical protein